ncbi:MAG: zinc metallopeptidase, partial [Planctomycetota bacterium]
LPIMARTGIFPLVAIGSNLWMPVAILGIILSAGQSSIFFDIAIMLLSGVIVFQVITLPIEFNASRRALALLTEKGIITSSEHKPTGAVLNAAALTYLAALLLSILHLVRLLVLRNQRDD